MSEDIPDCLYQQIDREMIRDAALYYYYYYYFIIIIIIIISISIIIIIIIIIITVLSIRAGSRPKQPATGQSLAGYFRLTLLLSLVRNLK